MKTLRSISEFMASILTPGTLMNMILERVPTGYQDVDGFHFGEEPQPACGCLT
jgi:hypothetical protein